VLFFLSYCSFYTCYPCFKGHYPNFISKISCVLCHPIGIRSWRYSGRRMLPCWTSAALHPKSAHLETVIVSSTFHRIAALISCPLFYFEDDISVRRLFLQSAIQWRLSYASSHLKTTWSWRRPWFGLFANDKMRTRWHRFPAILS